MTVFILLFGTKANNIPWIKATHSHLKAVLLVTVCVYIYNYVLYTRYFIILYHTTLYQDHIILCYNLSYLFHYIQQYIISYYVLLCYMHHISIKLNVYLLIPIHTYSFIVPFVYCILIYLALFLCIVARTMTQSMNITDMYAPLRKGIALGVLKFNLDGARDGGQASLCCDHESSSNARILVRRVNCKKSPVATSLRCPTRTEGGAGAANQLISLEGKVQNTICLWTSITHFQT